MHAIASGTHSSMTQSASSPHATPAANMAAMIVGLSAMYAMAAVSFMPSMSPAWSPIAAIMAASDGVHSSLSASHTQASSATATQVSFVAVPAAAATRPRSTRAASFMVEEGGGEVGGE